MATSRVPTARRLGGAAVASALVAVVTGAGALSAAAAPPSSLRLSTTPDLTTSGVTDGQGVIIDGAVPNPGQAIGVAQCKGGIPDTPDALAGTTTLQGRTVPKIQALCTTVGPGTDGGNPGVQWRLMPAPGDGTFGLTYWVKQGTIKQENIGTEAPFLSSTFECNPDSPCSLAVYQAGRTTDGFQYEPTTDPKVLKVLPLTFAKDPAAACGAATDGTVTAAGPGSMQSVLNLWGGATCAKGQPTPLLVDYTQSGDRAGQDSFISGVNDFAITPTGFADLHAPAKLSSTRAAVWTPLAAQAAVIAYQGGADVNDGENGIYSQTAATDVAATVTEVATLFSHNGELFNAPLDKPIVDRSPVLKAAQAGDGVNPERVIQPNGAPADQDSITLVATRAFVAAKSGWKFGVTTRFPDQLSPTEAIPLYSSNAALRAAIDKKIYAGNPTGFYNGIRVYLTDSATAAQYGLRTMKLRNAAGKFVDPTPESMAAAVKGMKRTADGLLVADPANPDPAAYPLPMVEYAASAAKPYDDAARKNRLVDFLRYATGTQAQASLPGGLFPLTPDLRTEATASLAKIGAAATTKPRPTAPTPSPAGGGGSIPPATVGDPPAASGGGGGSGGSLPASGSSAGSAGSTRTRSTAAATPGVQALRAARPASAQAVSDAATIPVFPGLRNSGLGRALPTIGLVLLALLVSAAGWLSSGRAVPALPAGVRRRLPRLLVRRPS